MAKTRSKSCVSKRCPKKSSPSCEASDDSTTSMRALEKRFEEETKKALEISRMQQLLPATRVSDKKRSKLKLKRNQPNSTKGSERVKAKPTRTKKDTKQNDRKQSGERGKASSSKDPVDKKKDILKLFETIVCNQPYVKVRKLTPDDIALYCRKESELSFATFREEVNSVISSSSDERTWNEDVSDGELESYVEAIEEVQPTQEGPRLFDDSEKEPDNASDEDMPKIINCRSLSVDAVVGEGTFFLEPTIQQAPSESSDCEEDVVVNSSDEELPDIEGEHSVSQAIEEFLAFDTPEPYRCVDSERASGRKRRRVVATRENGSDVEVLAVGRRRVKRAVQPRHPGFPHNSVPVCLSWWEESRSCEGARVHDCEVTDITQRLENDGPQGLAILHQRISALREIADRDSKNSEIASILFRSFILTTCRGSSVDPAISNEAAKVFRTMVSMFPPKLMSSYTGETSPDPFTWETLQSIFEMLDLENASFASVSADKMRRAALAVQCLVSVAEDDVKIHSARSSKRLANCLISEWLNPSYRYGNAQLVIDWIGFAVQHEFYLERIKDSTESRQNWLQHRTALKAAKRLVEGLQQLLGSALLVTHAPCEAVTQVTPDLVMLYDRTSTIEERLRLLCSVSNPLLQAGLIKRLLQIHCELDPPGDASVLDVVNQYFDVDCNDFKVPNEDSYTETDIAPTDPELKWEELLCWLQCLLAATIRCRQDRLKVLLNERMSLHESSQLPDVIPEDEKRELRRLLEVKLEILVGKVCKDVGTLPAKLTKYLTFMHALVDANFAPSKPTS